MSFRKFLFFILALSFGASIGHAQVIQYNNDREAIHTMRPNATSSVIFTKDVLTVIIPDAPAPKEATSIEETKKENSEQETSDNVLPDAPTEKTPSSSNDETVSPTPSTITRGIEYDITIKHEQPAQQTNFLKIDALKQGQATLLIYHTEERRAINHAPIYHPMDYAFIDTHGNIVQMTPQLVQAELRAPIVAEKAVKGLLYLPAGDITGHGISLQSYLSHPLFQQAPTVLK